jgi:asparagine synthase (glutamine-hydrolysing)
MADSTNFYVGRDPIGVRPLFYGRQPDGALVFGSEVKCIEKLCERVEYFPPGCCAQIALNDVRRILPLRIQQYYIVPSMVERHVRVFEAEVCLSK